MHAGTHTPRPACETSFSSGASVHVFRCLSSDKKVCRVAYLARLRLLHLSELLLMMGARTWLEDSECGGGLGQNFPGPYLFYPDAGVGVAFRLHPFLVTSASGLQVKLNHLKCLTSALLPCTPGCPGHVGNGCRHVVWRCLSQSPLQRTFFFSIEPQLYLW